MVKKHNHTLKCVAIAAIVALPNFSIAGGYGDTAVRDNRVGNVATNTPTVPCPRLNQNVPANLAAQMDCGSAQPAVAGERVRNTGVLGRIFGGHKRGAGPGAGSSDDEPTNVRVSQNPPPTSPTDPSDPSDPSGPSDPTTPTDNGFISKSDRLSELGIDYQQSPQSVKDQINEYRDDNGSRGDWSDFNPTTE